MLGNLVCKVASCSSFSFANCLQLPLSLNDSLELFAKLENFPAHVQLQELTKEWSRGWVNSRSAAARESGGRIHPT